jgi:DNA-binding CsgD family transcriptional regulator
MTGLSSRLVRPCRIAEVDGRPIADWQAAARAPTLADMVRTALIYGTALALGTVALQWLGYRAWAQSHVTEAYLTLLALSFMGLGIWVGARLFRPHAPAGAFELNARALASLGITEREHEVLRQLAAGRSNKEIARRLNLSPNTVKTHIARLYAKLEAARRTEAVLRARELRLIP